MNNFNKIKNMTIDEMSKFLSNVVYCEMCPVSDFCDVDTTYQECPEQFKQWLLSKTENVYNTKDGGLCNEDYKLITKAIEKFLKYPQRKQFVKESLKKARESTDKLLEMMRYKYNEKVFYSGE